MWVTAQGLKTTEGDQNFVNYLIIVHRWERIVPLKDSLKITGPISCQLWTAKTWTDDSEHSPMEDIWWLYLSILILPFKRKLISLPLQIEGTFKKLWETRLYLLCSNKGVVVHLKKLGKAVNNGIFHYPVSELYFPNFTRYPNFVFLLKIFTKKSNV